MLQPRVRDETSHGETKPAPKSLLSAQLDHLRLGRQGRVGQLMKQTTRLKMLFVSLTGALDAVEAIESMDTHPDLCFELLDKLRPLIAAIEPAYEVVLQQAEQQARRF